MSAPDSVIMVRDRRIVDSLQPGNIINKAERTWSMDWIDTTVYPRLQYRERYYNAGERIFT